MLALALLGAAGNCEDALDPDDDPQATGDLALSIETQPAGAASGLPLETQPVVQILDADGNPVTDDHSTVVSATIGSGGGTLEGGTNATASAGVAAFADLAVRGVTGERTLTFSASGASPITSSPFTLRPGRASTDRSSVETSASSVPVGQSVELSLVATDAEGNAHTEGGLDVQFTASGGTSQGVIGSTQDLGDGTYSASFQGTEPGTPTTIGATLDGEPVTSPLPTIRVVSDGDPPDNTTETVPLIDMHGLAYFGFEGLLYPGSNTIPDDHAARQPAIDASRPIAMISVSMSNGRYEFCDPNAGDVGPQDCASYSFVGQAAADPDVSPDVVIVNAAQGGQPAEAWESPDQQAYDVADAELTRFDLGPDDVQVVWLKQANPGPTISLPDENADAYTLLERLGNIVRAIKVRYPNVKQLYLSSRIWSCASGGLNGEPWAYESGFSVKWLIEAQIRQLDTGEVDGRAGDLGLDVAPWLAWGPYLWANDGNERSDGLTWTPDDLTNDCTHPGVAGRTKVGSLLLEFFKSSSLTASWFVE